MMFIKFIKVKDLITFLISIFFSIIISLLIYKQIIYPTIIPMIKNGIVLIFPDWSVILNANICQTKGFDVYLDNPCDQWNRKHVYGEVLLKIPFIIKFPKFYFLILPIILNFLFIYTIVSFFNFKNKLEYLTIFSFLLSVPVILAIERANIDIIIFLLMVLIAKNQKLLLNHLLLVLVTISKFYPISMAIIFLFKKKFKNIILNIIIFFLVVLSILFLQSDQLIKIFNNQSQFSSTGIYGFSIFNWINSIKDFNIYIKGDDYTWIKYLYIVIILLIPLTITIVLKLRDISFNKSISQLFFINSFENRLYILSTAVTLICYFSFSSYPYREIFFLGLIPWIIKEKNSINAKYFLNIYFYILSGKFLISTMLIFIERNNIFSNFKPVIVITKHCIDFYLIGIILLIFLFAIKSLYKELLRNNV